MLGRAGPMVLAVQLPCRAQGYNGGSFSMPLASNRSSASRTRMPPIVRSGAISASGAKTKARSNRRGCGSVRSGSLKDKVAVSKDVEVEHARSPAALGFAVAAQRAFNRECARQQIARRQRSGDGNDGVDEGRLIGDAPRRRAIIRRARQQPHRGAVAQHGDCSIECLPHVADIAAERDQGFRQVRSRTLSHVFSHVWRRACARR